ncbi:fucolectin-like [Haliotis rufescens]|uniref:fucolectin-like n=1 Tax=Haliotis rufescens TaxID=6454 RepID=UPI00201F42FC|nr:fucolectin-like [Haliotis rufescens]
MFTQMLDQYQRGCGMASVTCMLYSIVCFLPGAYQTASIVTNVALGKPTIQSSTYPGGNSSYAVDGRTGGNFFSDHCMLTRDGNTWWLVDLLHVYNISTVIVFRRTDFPGRAEQVKIEGFVQQPRLCPASSPKVCVNQLGSFTGPSKTVACEQEVMARYVRVSSTTCMTLCEIQMFGQNIGGCLRNKVQVQEGHKLDDSSITMLRGNVSSIVECSIHCYRLHNCLFFNFNRLTGECQTGSGQETSASSSAADWDFGTIC